MSRFLDSIQHASIDRLKPRTDWSAQNRPFRVLTVTNNKGGIGKTTVAANLAVYIRALREDLPILVVGLDDQNTLDRMFSLDLEADARNVLHGFRAGSFRGIARQGQFGIHYVPACNDVTPLKESIRDCFELQTILERTGWRGLVILDTKSDFEILTRNALAASDLTLVLIKDYASLLQAQKIYGQLEEWGRHPDQARVLLSMVDLRIKYKEASSADVLALLIAEIRRRGHPMLESFVSYSPKVASLETNPGGRSQPALIGASGSLVHQQFKHLAHDVLKLLDQGGLPNRTGA